MNVEQAWIEHKDEVMRVFVAEANNPADAEDLEAALELAFRIGFTVSLKLAIDALYQQSGDTDVGMGTPEQGVPFPAPPLQMSQVKTEWPWSRRIQEQRRREQH